MTDGVIPFYGADDRRLFDIERTAMDRPQLVIAAIDALLPIAGVVLDIGAGDGFTAERLTGAGRAVVPVEPASGMWARQRPLPWVGASAVALPFASASADAAYATWAYFFSRGWDPTPGLRELDRAVRAGGQLVIAENLGGDEFSALGDESLVADCDVWAGHGFECTEVDTVFQFDSPDDADELLTAYFGPSPDHRHRLTVEYRVGLFHRPSRGGG